MAKLVNCILLVDDNDDDNFFHKRIIERSGNVERVPIVRNGLEALEYLNNEGEYKNAKLNPRPNIILLDINMPKMNGFEFLEQYEKLDDSKKAEVCITMLSTSKNIDDINKAKDEYEVLEFISKPLNVEMLNELIYQYLKVIDSK